MSSLNLAEYRCTCGKLLFKGLLYQCVIEVKCRRCGEITTRGIEESDLITFFESDANAVLTDASGDVKGLLGKDKSHFIGKPLFEVFPLLRDTAEKAPNGYALREGALVLHDGEGCRIESYLIPKYKEGVFVGYRIFSRKKI